SRGGGGGPTLVRLGSGWWSEQAGVWFAWPAVAAACPACCGFGAGFVVVAAWAQGSEVVVVVGASGFDVDDVVDFVAGGTAVLAGVVVAGADAAGGVSGDAAVASGCFIPGHGCGLSG